MKPEKVARIAAQMIKKGMLVMEGGKLVKAPQNEAFMNHVTSLKGSPLFNLSLASKELFHSNFLAWLCEAYPDFMGPLFARYTKAPCKFCESLVVERERKKKDLTITFPNMQVLIVENKVKSMVDRRQLKKYSDGVKDKTRTSFLALYLVRPPYVSPNDVVVVVGDTSWHLLSYTDLTTHLENIIPTISSLNTYRGALLVDYVAFTRSLAAIASHVAVDWDDNNADFFLNQESKMLGDIRLNDMMDKMRYAQLAQKVAETLKADGCCVVATDDFWDAEPDVIMLSSALYHGKALCEFKYLLRSGKNKMALGVMFQGSQFNVFIDGGPDSVNKITRKSAELLMAPTTGGRLWFDLARIRSSEPEMPKKTLFKQFTGSMYYRSKKIVQSSPKGIVDLLVSYVRFIRENADHIRKHIDAACKS